MTTTKKKTKMKTRVAKFGVRRIVENKDIAVEHMYLAHKYYNTRAEIELESRTRYREIREKYIPGISDAEKREKELRSLREELSDQIKILRKHNSVEKDDEGNPYVRPTKKVSEIESLSDRLKEVEDDLKKASAEAKELRDQFRKLIEKGNEEWERRKRPYKTMSLKAIRGELSKQMLSEDWPDAWKEVHAFKEEINKKCNNAQTSSGVYNGTYNQVNEAIRRASNDSRYNVKFKPWNGCGRLIATQVEGNTTVKDVLNGKSRYVQIVHRRRARPKSRGRRALWEFATVRIRVGSKKGREPIWVGVETLIDRPMPQDAVVKWVRIVPHRVGLETVYSVQFTIRTPKELRPYRCGEGKARLHVKWSLEPLRSVGQERDLIVAEVNGEPICVPGEVLSMMELAQGDGVERRGTKDDHKARHMGGIRGASDVYFDRAKNSLKKWVEEDPKAFPEWLVDEVSHIHMWKKHAKLAVLVNRWSSESDFDTVKWFQKWKDHRGINPPKGTSWRWWRKTREKSPDDLLAPFDEIREWLEKEGVTNESHQYLFCLEVWRRKDMHLVTYWTRLNRKAINKRNDHYRKVAADLASRYETIEVDNLDLRRLAKRKKPGKDEDEIHKKARRQRFNAAPSVLLKAIEESFGPKRFIKVEKVPDAPVSPDPNEAEAAE